MPRFLSPRLAALSLLSGGGLAAVAAGASLTACPGTATPTVYSPPPGVALHLGDVIGALRCGTGPDEVYKYTVVVWDATDDGGMGKGPLYANVWDCFSDAVFDNLPAAPEGGSMAFFLRIYAYSYAGALAAQGSASAGSGDAGGADAINGAFWCQGGLGAGGATCRFVEDAGTAVSLADQAQWTTTCSANEPSGAPITAVCSPLQPVLPSSNDAAAEASPDAGAADAPGESGSPDSSAADSTRPDSGSPDASAPDSGPSDSSSSESSAADSGDSGGD